MIIATWAYKAQCDGRGCWEQAPGIHATEESAASEAEYNGWTRAGCYWFCPDCWNVDGYRPGARWYPRPSAHDKPLLEVAP